MSDEALTLAVKIHRLLEAKGHICPQPVASVSGAHIAEVDGIHVSIHVVPNYRKTFSHRQDICGYKIAVGPTDRVWFKLRKDGTHDYVRLLSVVENRVAQSKREQAQRASIAVAEEAIEKASRAKCVRTVNVTGDSQVRLQIEVAFHDAVSLLEAISAWEIGRAK